MKSQGRLVEQHRQLETQTEQVLGQVKAARDAFKEKVQKAGKGCSAQNFGETSTAWPPSTGSTREIAQAINRLA